MYLCLKRSTKFVEIVFIDKKKLVFISKTIAPGTFLSTVFLRWTRIVILQKVTENNNRVLIRLQGNYWIESQTLKFEFSPKHAFGSTELSLIFFPAHKQSTSKLADYKFPKILFFSFFSSSHLLSKANRCGKRMYE